MSTSELSKRPAKILGRVARGERFIVCRHNEPVATLQPLDGYVLQPFDGTAHDIFGWAIRGAADEIEKLSEAERRLLLDGYRDWRLRPTRTTREFDFGVLNRAIEDMGLRGLAERRFEDGS
ncbi:MAG: type II toxin-antitoxin system Phd/YefM family antitoxin [Actinomycetota bacterium]|nr:type II toxin-antitoxin system Phd/YefM family antitoxin [Actinomycetota bacterium]